MMASPPGVVATLEAKAAVDVNGLQRESEYQDGTDNQENGEAGADAEDEEEEEEEESDDVSVFCSP